MRLNEIQNEFKDTMFGAPAPALEELLNVPARLDIYRNNVIGGLLKVLMTGFPLVTKLTGEDFMRQMARAFVTGHPPAHGCLNTYGEDFPGFIKNYAPANSLAYLPDVAAFEAARLLSEYAADDAPFTTEHLSAVPEDKIFETSLQLRRSAYLVSSQYPLTAIAAFCDAPEGMLDVSNKPEDLLIHRPHHKAMVTPLSAGERDMLAALHKGETLGAALESVLNAHPGFDCAAFLQAHIKLGTFRAP